MNRLTVILPFLLALPCLPVGPAYAYSYAASGQEPLLDGRDALFKAVAAGDWAAAQMAVTGMNADLTYLDGNEDKGVMQAFTDALAAKDAAQVTAAFTRAATDEMERRLNGAGANLDTYQVAKTLVVTANRFYTAIAGDLPPEASAQVGAAMTVAIDAVGNPGVFGVGAKKPDPQAFGTAKATILKALGKTQ